jgi:hypothetical protein
LARLLDEAIAIPFTRIRIGLDPIIGIIPGGGDMAGLVLSGLIIMEAAGMGAPKGLLSQMVFNVLLESIAGVVPVVGDLFDVAWKSNVKNIRLLEDHLHITPDPQPRNRAFAVFLLVGLVFAVIGLMAVSVIVLRWFWLTLTEG